MGEQDSHKRKGGPGKPNHGPHKKSKGGVAKRWQTPHQKARLESQVEHGSRLEVGDSGLWVTYARGQRPRAVREFVDLCEERLYQYGSSMYGIKPASSSDDKVESGQEEDEDIEASIKKELEEMQEKRPKPGKDRIFTTVNTGIECVFFLKAKKPVDAVELARKLCHDAAACTDIMQRKCKYINRLIPVIDTDKATANGIERVARTVLAEHFALRSTDGQTPVDGAAKAEGEESFGTYAIRHNIRNHKDIKSADLVQKVAALVDVRHKVNLTKPDKVILVEVFQLYCGVSVVDGHEWETLKRYNMNELYRVHADDSAQVASASTITGDARAVGV